MASTYCLGRRQLRYSRYKGKPACRSLEAHLCVSIPDVNIRSIQMWRDVGYVLQLACACPAILQIFIG